MMKKTLQLSGLHCVNCSLLIEEDLADIGVTAKANYAKQTVDVTYDPKKTKEKSIIEAIQHLGYTVLKE
jgi:copper chaperone CopZ